MGLMCSLGKHKWDKCKCSVCGKTQHEWNKNSEACTRCGGVLEIATISSAVSAA
ncbi:MAG: hypothetical protein JW787_02880 [Sedimentisphaerales bacterium]|nr:hypothetical protein [Sedimentisphaerales bacterium]